MIKGKHIAGACEPEQGLRGLARRDKGASRPRRGEKLRSSPLSCTPLKKRELSAQDRANDGLFAFCSGLAHGSGGACSREHREVAMEGSFEKLLNSCLKKAKQLINNKGGGNKYIQLVLLYLMTEQQKRKRGLAVNKLWAMIGRLLGVAKRKERDIVQEWLDLCHAHGIKPWERILQFIAADLQSNFPAWANIKDVKTASKIQEAFNYAELTRSITELAKKMMQEKLELITNYSAALQQREMEILQLRRALDDLTQRVQELSQQIAMQQVANYTKQNINVATEKNINRESEQKTCPAKQPERKR